MASPLKHNTTNTKIIKDFLDHNLLLWEAERLNDPCKDWTYFSGNMRQLSYFCTICICAFYQWTFSYIILPYISWRIITYAKVTRRRSCHQACTWERSQSNNQSSQLEGTVLLSILQYLITGFIGMMDQSWEFTKENKKVRERKK